MTITKFCYHQDEVGSETFFEFTWTKSNLWNLPCQIGFKWNQNSVVSYINEVVTLITILSNGAKTVKSYKYRFQYSKSKYCDVAWNILDSKTNSVCTHGHCMIFCTHHINTLGNVWSAGIRRVSAGAGCSITCSCTYKVKKITNKTLSHTERHRTLQMHCFLFEGTEQTVVSKWICCSLNADFIWHVTGSCLCHYMKNKLI